MHKRSTHNNHSLDELRQQLAACPLFDGQPLDAAVGAWIRAEGLDDVPCTVLELDIRPRKALRRLEIETLGELLRTPYERLTALKNLSRTSLRRLRQEVEQYLCRQKNLPLPPLPPRDRLSVARRRQRMARAQKVLTLFNALGSYVAVARRLNISREGVRQILKAGRKQRWIDWEPVHLVFQKRRQALRKEWRPETLQRALLELGSIERVRAKYNLKHTEMQYLLETYQVDASALRHQTSIEQTLADYAVLVEELGHHPSWTELNASEPTGLLANRIQRLWGGVTEFRRSLGIRVAQAWTAKQHQARRRYLRARREQIYRQRWEMLRGPLRASRSMGLDQVAETLGVCGETASKILTYWKDQGWVRVVRKDGRRLQITLARANGLRAP